MKKAEIAKKIIFESYSHLRSVLVKEMIAGSIYLLYEMNVHVPDY